MFVRVLVPTLLLTVITGCSSTRSWDGLASRLPVRKQDQDELALKNDSLTSGFRESQDELKDAERTQLTFARWKEDIGQYAEARHRYQEILTENPDCLTARLGIARIERETGRFDQCREILLTACEKYPGDASVRLELGRMYSEREQWKESVRYLNEAADIDPNNETIRYELGLSLAQAGQFDAAVDHLKYAVGTSAAMYNVGYILQQRGRTSESLTWFERALGSHPDERTRRMTTEMLAQLDTPHKAESETMIAGRSAALPRSATVEPTPPRTQTVAHHQAPPVHGGRSTPTAHSAATTAPPAWSQMPQQVASIPRQHSAPGHQPGAMSPGVPAAPATSAPYAAVSWQTPAAPPAHSTPQAPTQWNGPASPGVPPVHNGSWSRPVAPPTAPAGELPAWRPGISQTSPGTRL